MEVIFSNDRFSLRKTCIALVVYAVMLFSAVHNASAGECETSNDELYKIIVNQYKAAKNEPTEELGGPECGLDYWAHEKRDDAKLKKLFKEIMFDSRIHPSDVVIAVQDYEKVFGAIKLLEKELKSKQGESRFALIDRLLKQEKSNSALPPLSVPKAFIFPPEIDFINGPAPLHKEPNGSVAGTLPDNTKVLRGAQQGEWAEVKAGKLTGWAKQNALIGLNVNAINPEGNSPLSRAAYMGYLETVHYLLAHGADVTFVDRFGRTPIHWVIMGGIRKSGGTEGAILKRLSEVRRLDPNRKDSDGNTPLMLAVESGSIDLIESLLKFPTIDVNVIDQKGVPLLSRAVQRSNSEILKILLKASNVNIDILDSEGRSLLYYAIAGGSLNQIQQILSLNPKTDTVTNDGKTLYHAIFTGSPERAVNPETALILQQYKNIDINKPDNNGKTVLQLAIESKQSSAIRNLLSIPQLKRPEGVDLK